MSKQKTFTIRLDNQLFEKMEKHKEDNDINWSAKIRRFIVEELKNTNEKDDFSNVVTNQDKKEKAKEEQEQTPIERYNDVSNELNNAFKVIHDIEKRRKMQIHRKADDQVYSVVQTQIEMMKRELELLEKINFMDHYPGEDE